MVSIIEVISSPLFIVTYLFAVVSTMILIFSFKYALFGVKAFFKKMSGRYGLLWLKMPGGNIKFPPYFVDMEKTEVTIKKKGITKQFPIGRSDFDEGKFFGFPFCIKDHDDVIKTYGLYAQAVNKDYKPLYHKFSHDGKEYETNIPVLTKEKSANLVDPELIHGMIAKAGILDSLKELFDKNKTLLYVIVASIAVSGIALYVAYESYTMLQNITPVIQNIQGQIAAQNAGAMVPAP